MNKRNFRSFKLFILIVPLLLLTGCWFDLNGFISAFLPNSSSSSFVAPSINENTDAFYKPASFTYNNRELGESIGAVHLSSLGEQKLLVVPVVFKDPVSQNLATPFNKDAINRAFFGQSEQTGWESVASYYNKSSYGKLSLIGEVTDYFYLNMTLSELENKPTDDFQYWDATHYVLEEVYDAFSLQNNGKILRDYDTDGDGYVDAVYFVYMAPYDYTSDVFWAYMYYWNYNANTAKPPFNSYAWSSYRFMEEGQGYSLTNVDAHTYIHETGHLLGLDDYYDGLQETNPSGSFDMMTYNVVDHAMYSKYVLNWSQPYVINDTTKVTLQPAESSGDFVILNANWNGHAYDEYILLEYFTPTGLNEQDSLGYGYQNYKPFTQSGVKIYHIDSRLIALAGGSYYYTDEIISTGSTYTIIAASNTVEWSVREEYKLIHLLNANPRANDWYDINVLPTNSALFKTGDKIANNNWKAYLKTSSRFNNGQTINFSIEIGEMDSDSVDIYFTKH